MLERTAPRGRLLSVVAARLGAKEVHVDLRIIAVVLCAVGCAADSPRGNGRNVMHHASGQNDTTTAGSSAGHAGSSAGSAFGNAGSAQVPASGSAGVPATPPAEMGCPDGTANAMPITPTVWLVVDGSSSMNEAFDAGRTRWETLRSTLMDSGGVVETLQAVARIGMVIYSGGGLGGAECVQLVTVEPALDNYATLDAQYPQDPIGMGTPTDRALDHVVTNLPVVNVDMLDQELEPVYVVLATDGQPNDSCGGNLGDSTAVQQSVIDVTTRGTQMGMNMFVISLAAGMADLQSHLEQVAQATLTKTPPFVPDTQAELVATFLGIVGSATCLVSLDGRVKDGQQCLGAVLLNGTPLTCDSDNGWRLSDPSTVELTGTACEDFRASQSQVYASFPCGVLVE
jgi:hypothetical protein